MDSNQPAPKPTEDAPWSDQREHLQTGHETVQNVIEFLDSKNNILIGLATVVAGFSTAFVKWMVELPPTHPLTWTTLVASGGCAGIWASVLLGISLIAFVSVILFCLWSVIARHAAPGQVTLLFPVPRGKEVGKSHSRAIRKRVAELDYQQMKDEYADQLAQTGKIVRVKLWNNRAASIALLVQVIAVVLSLVLFFCKATFLP